MPSVQLAGVLQPRCFDGSCANRSLHIPPVARYTEWPIKTPTPNQEPAWQLRSGIFFVTIRPCKHPTNTRGHKFRNPGAPARRCQSVRWSMTRKVTTLNPMVCRELMPRMVLSDRQEKPRKPINRQTCEEPLPQDKKGRQRITPCANKSPAQNRPSVLPGKKNTFPGPPPMRRRVVPRRV